MYNIFKNICIVFSLAAALLINTASASNATFVARGEHASHHNVQGEHHNIHHDLNVHHDLSHRHAWNNGAVNGAVVVPEAYPVYPTTPTTTTTTPTNGTININTAPVTK